jgi:hypothetical protein
MDQTQSALDYKDYFRNKFASIFGELLNMSIDFLPIESEDIQNLIKIKNYGEKLNFDKVITKMASNTRLFEITNLLIKNTSEDEVYFTFFKNKEKYWTIIPTFNINTILLQIVNRQTHLVLLNKIADLHICAKTYEKVIEQITLSESDGKEFNPFESIGNVNSNIDVNTLFEGVEVKNISAYDMIMSTLINQETNNKMDEYMNNIKESDVNEAAEKLTGVLESDNFQGNKKTSQLLSNMLANIKDEVIGLKNNNNGTSMQGKQGVEQLLSIAQKVAGNMMGQIQGSDVSVLEIWDATSSLAKNTVKSDALNIVDNLIRSNIMQNANAKYNQSNGENNKMENNTEQLDTNQQDNVKKSRKSKKNKDNNE